MGLKEEYKKKLQAQLDEMKQEIDKLQAKADKAEADIKIQYYNAINEIKKKQVIAEKKLQELSQAKEGAWEELKVGVEKSWKNLSDAVKSAVERFKRK